MHAWLFAYNTYVLLDDVPISSSSNIIPIIVGVVGGVI